MDIAFVGLGAMGSGIVPRLMAAGHAVTGWNRSRQKAEPLIAAGMRFAPTPRAAAAAADVVFSIVTDAAAVRSVALGADIYPTKFLNARVNLFYNLYDDLIDFGTNEEGTGVPWLNSGSADQYGSEISLDFYITTWLKAFTGACCGDNSPAAGLLTGLVNGGINPWVDMLI